MIFRRIGRKQPVIGVARKISLLIVSDVHYFVEMNSRFLFFHGGEVAVKWVEYVRKITDLSDSVED